MKFQPVAESDFYRFFKNNVKFKGVFCRDNLPKKLKDGYYVLNLDEVSGQGTHWTCFKIVNRDYTIYFDPYGALPPTEVLNQLPKPIMFNRNVFQPINSNLCGYFCFYVILQLMDNREFNDILLDFSLNTRSNNNLIKKFATRHKL